MVRNQALKRLARGARVVPQVAPEVAHFNSPESQLLQTEVAKVVASAVAALPDAQKEVLILAHYEQMPLAEIARVTGIEVTAVKSRLQRARASLREALAFHAPCVEKR